MGSSARFSGFERALWAGIGSGRFVGPDTPGDTFADTPSSPEAVVRAEVLYRLLATDEAGQASPRGLRLRGARIVGELNLAGAVLRCPLTLQSCYIEERVDLTSAVAPELRFSGCSVPALSGAGLKVLRSLELNHGFTASEPLVLVGAHIGGDLDLSQARLVSGADAERLVVEGAGLFQALSSDGGFSLFDARIDGPVRLDDAKLTSPQSPALFADGLRARALMCRAVRSIGGIRLIEARVTTQVSFDDAWLESHRGAALDADGLTVDGLVSCRRMKAQGTVRLRGAHLNSSIVLDGAELESDDTVAFHGDGLVVAGLMSGYDLRAKGAVRLLASILHFRRAGFDRRSERR